jgi:hypothetical protein
MSTGHRNAGLRESPLTVWWGRLALVFWLLALASSRFWVYSGASVDLRSARAALDSASALGVGMLIEWAVFVPIGFLAVYCWRAHRRWWRRALLVTLPALALGAGAVVLVGAAHRNWGLPSAPWLLLPLIGTLAGVWLGSAWRRGPRSRAWILPKLGMAGILAVAGLAYLAQRIPQPAPLPFEPPRVTTADKKRLTALFRGKDPRKIPEGETRTLRLTEGDLNQLLALGSILGRGERAKARVEVHDDGLRFSASAALPAPGSPYLNLLAAGRPGVASGAFQLRADGLSIGNLALPDWLLRLASPLLTGSLRLDPRLGPVLNAIEDVRFAPGAVEVEYARTELPTGALREMFQAASRDEELVPAVRAHALHLIETAPELPAGAERFGGALRTVFGYARERSTAEGAIAENRAGILALAILAGHWRVETLVGPVLDEGTRKQGQRAFRNTEIRGRRDWVQHYLVSAALAVLADAGLSDAAGVLKEELDSRGGSGFSFGDLLADRAGTSLGEVAIRDVGSARALQEHLAGGFRLDDFFPEASDLPEGLEEAELEARYGGVGGERYQAIVGLIESRLAGCSAYRY